MKKFEMIRALLEPNNHSKFSVSTLSFYETEVLSKKPSIKSERTKIF